MRLCLFIDPGLYADPVHFSQIFEDMRMMAYSVYDVFFAEFQKPCAAFEPGTFIAAGDIVRCGTVPEAVRADVAAGSYFSRQASEAVLPEMRTGSAEKTADAGGFFG